MAETNFTLHSTDTNNYNVQKTFSGVNPEVTSTELVETAQGFNRLTDNTYVGTKRIDKLDADTEVDLREEATLTFNARSSSSDSHTYTVMYNGAPLSETVFDTFENKGTFVTDLKCLKAGFVLDVDTRHLSLVVDYSLTLGRRDITITLGGTTTHKPVTATVNIGV